MAVSLITAEEHGGSNGLDAIDSPASAAYLRAFLRDGPATLASTRELDRFVVLADGTPIPVVVNDGREDNCYILSPYAHYVKYARLEFDKIPGRQAQLLARGVSALGRISLPLGFNRCISVNNWLFTTNPNLALTPSQLAEVTEALVQRGPRYPIVFRCVDARDARTRRTFTDAGYRLVVNRPVHEWDPNQLKKQHRQEVRQDAKCLKDPRFTVESPAVLRAGEEEDIYRLYTALYVKKHKGYNCRYTARFFREVYKAGMMNFTLVRQEGRILAFLTDFDDGDRTVLALVGYDTSLDNRQFPLYRMLFGHGLTRAWERKRLAFLSTGVAAFKQNRGSYEWMEYEAVYDRHLQPHRRAPWALFKALYDQGVKNLDTSKI